MGIECQVREESMNQDENHPTAERGKKSCRTVDGARKHRGKNYKQDSVERSLPRE